ncbi:MAG: hypothetical protein HYY14_03930 [Candidatus Omnitrophica bacterium]|nr:hypothetical protein [Candidatus Omnitrophota bacterium]
MKPLDMTHITWKYRGIFVVLSPDRKRVIAKGHTLKEALDSAKKKGCKNSICAKIPEENKTYLL